MDAIGLQITVGEKVIVFKQNYPQYFSLNNVASRSEE